MTIPFVLWYVNSSLPPCSHSNAITWLQMKKSPATATGTDPARLLTLWRVFPGMEIRAVITWRMGTIKIYSLSSPVCQRERTELFWQWGPLGKESLSHTNCAWLSVTGVLLTASYKFSVMSNCSISLTQKQFLHNLKWKLQNYSPPFHCIYTAS